MIYNENFINQLLHACSKIRCLPTTKLLHAFTIKLGSNVRQPIFLGNNIMSQYASVGELSTSLKAFNKMSERNVKSYNIIISGFGRLGHADEAIRLFIELMIIGFRPTQFTLASIFSCPSLDLCRGSQLHALVSKNGWLNSDCFVGTALLGLYGRHECLDLAATVFEDMPNKSLVTWNSIITLFARHGTFRECMISFRELLMMQVSLSESSFVAVLPCLECKHDLVTGELIHGLVFKHGFEYEVSVLNSLINMYAKCGGTSLVMRIYKDAPLRDVVTFNSIIGAVTKTGRPLLALDFFLKMSEEGILSNQTTFVNIVISCASLQLPIYGQFVHAKIIKNNFDSDTYVGSTLVDFYAKYNKLDEAYSCFLAIKNKNVICWNALIMGYASKGSSSSLFMFAEMLRLGHQPSEFSFSAILRSSSFTAQSLLELQQLHCLIIRLGYQSNEFVSSSLISSYAKNGCIHDSLVFVIDSETPFGVVPSNNVAAIYSKIGHYHETVTLLAVLEEPDIVSWNILIAAYGRLGDYTEVFDLFKHMRMAGIHPDNYTYVSLVSACSKLCDLNLGSSVHGLVIKFDFDRCDTFLSNLIVNMYGKCGSVENAVKIFKQAREKNLITWTALISALGINGYGYEALEKFKELEFHGIKPDKVAFQSVLTACRHGGLVKEGMELFYRIQRNYKIEPEIEHYNSLVDLLARYGHIKEAENLISSMPFPPNVLIWRSFLEGCKQQRTAKNLLSEGHKVKQ